MAEAETSPVETVETVISETQQSEVEKAEAQPPEEAVSVAETVDSEMTEEQTVEAVEINPEIKAFQDKWEEYRSKKEVEDYNKFQEINKERLAYINGLEDPELLKKESEAFRRDWNEYNSAKQKLHWMQYQTENAEELAKINGGIDSVAAANSTSEVSEESSKQEEDRGFLDTMADGLSWTGEKIVDGAKTVGGAVADGASVTWGATKTVGGTVVDVAGWVYDSTKGVLTSVFDGSDETAADRIVAQAQEEFTSLQEQWETLKRETATNNITTGFWSRVFVTKTKVNAEIDRMNKSGEMDELWQGFYKEREKDVAAIRTCLNVGTENVESSTKADNIAATENEAGKPMTEVLAKSSAQGVQNTNIEIEFGKPNEEKGPLPLNIKRSSGR